jgi:peptidoglycan/LPS O-acetylase OafA/YrhL
MSTKQELTDLTVCRAVFALWVFIYHVDLHLDFSRFLGPAADLIRHGYLGVDGFFILSGLIMARVHPEFIGNLKYFNTERTLPKFKLPGMQAQLRFWGKRLARIYPVHLATILILAVIVGGGALHGWMPHDPRRFSLSSLLQNLLLVHGWGGSSIGAWNYPSWAISTEWAGYLLFPLLWCLLAYFSSLAVTQILIASAAALGLVFVFNGYNLNLTFADGLARFFPEFILGMATTGIVRVWADFAMVRRVSLIGGVVLALFSAAASVDLLGVIGLWLVLFSFLMQADTGLPALLGRRPALVWLGRRSYAFYMTFAISELLMSQFFQHHGWAPKSHALVFAAGMLGITMMLTISLYSLVETPCRRIADRWLVQPDAVPQNNSRTFVKG